MATWTADLLARTGERRLLTMGRMVAALHRRATGVVAVARASARAKPTPLVFQARASGWEPLASIALAVIAKAWRTSFHEARHAMFLPRAAGFSGDRSVYYGDVFQRALIADALCDALEVVGSAVRPMIEGEVQYLVARRLRDGVGGWRYFPDLPDLAPDADDLGQVLQVLVRAGHRDLANAYVTQPLRVLLDDCVHDDGSFETWIVPGRNRTATQELQLTAARAKWGTGADAEVMANLLYSLLLYDPRRFAGMCQRGAQFIARQQRGDGSWLCRWYFGPYYGTYACTRLLAALGEAQIIERAGDFVRMTQRADGGWGTSPGRESDALSTALALLTLASATRPSTAGGDAARAARAGGLLIRQAGRSGWPRCAFIRPSGVHSYGSRTITAAFVLKAARACMELFPTFADRRLSAGGPAWRS
ncbi:MAG: prenyltransferase/squalene oxidase repeat-containing protein [Gemmatimonadaceae bacterium]